MYAAWRNLKDHAKARGIPFRLALATFAKFAKASDYLNRKGNERGCLTVDRINNLKGYTARNIQPLTREKNREKQAKIDAIRYRAGHQWEENYADNHQHAVAH